VTEAGSRADPAPVLVVDQFEEVFLPDRAAGAAEALSRDLARYAAGRAPVVVVVRSDHVGRMALDDSFSRLVERGLVLVGPLSGDQLREAIERPAEIAGLRLEPGLTDLLVRDVEGEAGALPLLSHALVETWRRRDGHMLTVEAYRATGGIRGAVARTAERLYTNLSTDEQDALRSLMLRLVAPAPSGDPVRCRVSLPSL
jgi:hypothetical protein